MAISQGAWNEIWNDGFGAGYDARYKVKYGYPRAPSYTDLGISKGDWDAVWNAGFQAAYGKHISAPAPGDIATTAPPIETIVKGQPGTGIIQVVPDTTPAGTITKGQPGTGIIQVIPRPPGTTPQQITNAPPAGTTPEATAAGGLTSGSTFGYDADQWHSIYTLVKVGYDLHAAGKVIVAALCLGYGENSFHSHGCNSSNHCGVFQLSGALQAEHDYTDVGYWAKRAYESGFWSYSGLINNARRYPNESPGFWVNMCQGAYSNLVTGARYYDLGLPTANNLFNYWYPRISGGAKAPTSPGGPFGPTGAGTIHAPGGATLESVMKSENWAGDFEVLWQHAQAGHDQAVKAAQKYLRNLQGHDYETAH